MKMLRPDSSLLSSVMVLAAKILFGLQRIHRHSSADQWPCLTRIFRGKGSHSATFCTKEQRFSQHTHGKTWASLSTVSFFDARRTNQNSGFVRLSGQLSKSPTHKRYSLSKVQAVDLSSNLAQTETKGRAYHCQHPWPCFLHKTHHANAFANYIHTKQVEV